MLYSWLKEVAGYCFSMRDLFFILHNGGVYSYAPILYSFIHLVSDRCDVVLYNLTFYSAFYSSTQEGERATKAMMKISRTRVSLAILLQEHIAETKVCRYFNTCMRVASRK